MNQSQENQEKNICSKIENWVYYEDDTPMAKVSDDYICCNCGKRTDFQFNFCPNCGVKITEIVTYINKL